MKHANIHSAVHTNIAMWIDTYMQIFYRFSFLSSDFSLYTIAKKKKRKNGKISQDAPEFLVPAVIQNLECAVSISYA